MKDERQATEEDRALQRKVESLAREIAETINGGLADEREVLREFAVHLVRDQVHVVDTRSQGGTAASGAFSPLAVAIPFLMMGAILIFLFPLMGVAMFGAASIMIAWGIVATLFARR